MKTVQYNKDSDALVVDTATSSAPLNVGGYGPLTITKQLTISDSDTPVNAEAQLRGSIDGTNYFDVGSPVSLTGDGVFSLVADDVRYLFYQVDYSLDSGEVTVVERTLIYGDRI